MPIREIVGLMGHPWPPERPEVPFLEKVCVPGTLKVCHQKGGFLSCLTRQRVPDIRTATLIAGESVDDCLPSRAIQASWLPSGFMP